MLILKVCFLYLYPTKTWRVRGTKQILVIVSFLPESSNFTREHQGNQSSGYQLEKTLHTVLYMHKNHWFLLNKKSSLKIPHTGDTESLD